MVRGKGWHVSGKKTLIMLRRKKENRTVQCGLWDGIRMSLRQKVRSNLLYLGFWAAIQARSRVEGTELTTSLRITSPNRDRSHSISKRDIHDGVIISGTTGDHEQEVMTLFWREWSDSSIKVVLNRQMHFRILDTRVVSRSVTSFMMISVQNSHVSTEDSPQKKFSCHVGWLTSLSSDWKLFVSHWV